MEPEVVYSSKRGELHISQTNNGSYNYWRKFGVMVGGCEAFTPDEFDALCKWWLKKNPSLIRSLLSPEQVEAIEWAVMVANRKAQETREQFEIGYDNQDAAFVERATVLSSLLGEEDAHAE